jgi:hypothetical protein
MALSSRRERFDRAYDVVEPMQRQMLPLKPRRISCSFGFGFSLSNSRIRMIIPGVQNPHCSAWCSWNAA